MLFHAAHRQALVLRRVALAQRIGRITRHAHGVVALERVVRAGLVGQRVGHDAAVMQPLQHVDRVRQHAYRNALAASLQLERAVDRRIQVLVHLVQVAVVHALLQALAADVGDQRRTFVHRDGKRLCTAHAAAAGGDVQRALERPAKVLARALGERLVRALQDSLRADVDPAARGHLPEHHQSARTQLVEVLLRGPVGDQVRIGDHHARRVGVGADDAHGLAALDQQRLVGLEPLQALDDRVEALPAARRLPAAAIDHQALGALGHLGVEVVHQHAHGRLGGPGLAGARGAARGADGAGGSGHGGSIIGGITVGPSPDHRCISPGSSPQSPQCRVRAADRP